jgi:glycosyltransferase involved in cell wall biosynthesis
MRILFLTQHSELGPSSRHRVYQLLPLLRQCGIECEVSPAIDSELYTQLYLEGRGSRRTALVAAWKKRRSDLERIGEFDAAFVQKGVLPGLYSGFERQIAGRKPFVFDFDDAIWLPRQGGSPIARAVHRESAVQDILRRATVVIAGNDFLAEYARHFNPQVTVVPSAIDVSRYSINRNREMIGWIGSSTTLPYLRQLKSVFERLGVIPRVIGSGDPSVLGFGLEFRPWRLETELSELSQFGIGIAPLPDTPWERGKCGVKVLQYMACGIPVVASAVGVHNQIIQHGVNGFLARNDAEWEVRLHELTRDPHLRARLGAAARKTVEDGYTIQRAADRVVTVLRGLR